MCSFDVSTPHHQDEIGVSNDRLPVGTIPLFATCSPEYETAVNRVINAANNVYRDFMTSEEGQGFSGQVVLIGDSVGSILAYDALCKTVKRTNSDSSMAEEHIREEAKRIESLPPSSTNDEDLTPHQSKSTNFNHEKESIQS